MGDLPQLLAATRKRSLPDTVLDLTRQGAFSATENELRDYYEVSKDQADLRKAWLDGVEFMRDHPDAGSLFAALSAIGNRPSYQQLHELAPHVCYLRREDLEDLPLPDSSKDTWRWWAQYSALAIPAWDGPLLAGFWLLTTKGTRYLQMISTPESMAFGLVSAVGDDWTMVVDQIEVAVQLAIWGQADTGLTQPFLCPHGLRDKPDNIRSRRLVYWTRTGRIQHYLRAVQTPGAQILPHHDLPAGPDGLPCNGRFSQFTRYIRSARPAHDAAARQLLDIPADEARAALVTQQIDPADRSRMLAYVQGEDARTLNILLSDVTVDRTISWSGHVISDTPQGWVCKGQMVSQVKLYIEQIRPWGDQGEAQATGTLVFVDRLGQRQVMSFTEQLSVLRKNTAEWLQRKVIAQAGKVPFIDSRWKSRILEIAQQFHEPTPVMANKHYGWDGQILHMPYFTVAEQITASSAVVDGPMLPLPSPLSPAEGESFRSLAFCRTYLALVGNLVRTQSGRPGLGLLLVNEQHVVARLASALGAEIVACPSGDLMDIHAQDPLPLFTEWTSSRLRELFARGGPKNVVVSVDRHTARLAAVRPEWLHLRIGDVLDYQALRGVFLILPRLMRHILPKPETEDFYRQLAALLAEHLQLDYPFNRLQQVAFELDQYYVCRNNSAGTRLVELMIYGVTEGVITVAEHQDYAEVQFADFRRATVSTTITMPPIEQITEALRESRCLIEVTDSAWRIGRSTWDIMRSLAGVRQPA